MSKLAVKYFVDNISKNDIINCENLITVGDLRKQLSQFYNTENFDVVYCGSCLNDAQLLNPLNLDENSVVYVLKSSKIQIPPAEKLDQPTFIQVIKSLRSILSDTQSKNWVEEKLKNPKLIDYIIEAVPAFGSDPIAMNILTDRHLLWKSLGKKKCDAEKTLSDHPSLGYAILILQGALNDDMQEKKNFQFKDARSLYNIDHMSDDEGDDEDDDNMDTDTNRRDRSNGRNPFSRLIAPAFTRPYGNNMATTSGMPSNNTAQQPNMITNDFFRQAMMFASGAAANNQQQQQQSSSSSSTPQQPQSNVDLNLIETQLQQLREMGITDDDLARRVLMETGGDLHATIEILFSSEDAM